MRVKETFGEASVLSTPVQPVPLMARIPVPAAPSATGTPPTILAPRSSAVGGVADALPARVLDADALSAAADAGAAEPGRAAASGRGAARAASRQRDAEQPAAASAGAAGGCVAATEVDAAGPAPVGPVGQGQVLAGSDKAALELTPAVQSQMRAEEFCVNYCQWSVRKTRDLLVGTASSSSRVHQWASAKLRDARIKELDELGKQLRMPGTSFVTVGDTGAGKSTLLNAILGEAAVRAPAPCAPCFVPTAPPALRVPVLSRRAPRAGGRGVTGAGAAQVLPTNGMRACTACIIELVHNREETGPAYRGEVEFVSLEEWAAELAVLIDDLTQQDGRISLREPDSKAPSYTSFVKVFSVYGEDFTRSTETFFNHATGKNERCNMRASDVKAKLLEHAKTRLCGTRVEETGDDARQFRRKLERYMDSTEELSAGQFWPLVKRVRMMGRGWRVLQSGAKLIDAPGVRDDNTARDRVVKEYLKNADGIWIVANIKRAVNNRTAKDMLGESFRRQLLMDGQYGQLAFIATQSDALLPDEVARNLALPPDTPLEECALARNRYTADRIQADFIAGLEDMARAAGDAFDAEEARSRFRLPVFCVSAVDFLKLTGVLATDGEPRAFSRGAHTQVPALQQFVHETTLRRRYANVRAATEGLAQWFESFAAYLAHEGASGDDALDAARRVFERELKRLGQEVRAPLARVAKQVGSSFKEQVLPRMEGGAADAGGACVALAQGWYAGPGKMHWATYKATCRRGGVFRRDWNAEMAEPLFRAVSTEWERCFVSVLAADLDRARTEALAALGRLHDALAKGLTAEARLPPARVRDLRRPQERAARAKLEQAVRAAREICQKLQRDVSRVVVPSVSGRMAPGYAAGESERGTGSARRRADVVEGQVKREHGTMFRAAVAEVKEGVGALQKELLSALQEPPEPAP